MFKTNEYIFLTKLTIKFNVNIYVESELKEYLVSILELYAYPMNLRPEKTRIMLIVKHISKNLMYETVSSVKNLSEK